MRSDTHAPYQKAYPKLLLRFERWGWVEGIDFKMLSIRNLRPLLTIVTALTISISSGCSLILPHSLAPEDSAPGLPPNDVAALESLRKIDSYPLYLMEIQGSYADRVITDIFKDQGTYADTSILEESWACSLFAAYSDQGQVIFGRNFDWDYSPALVLYTNPKDGYASVSMVDLAYLIDPEVIDELDQTDNETRSNLLYAPWMPFDGMNETGLAIGMAAVPHAKTPHDSSLPTYDSLAVMRLILDQAGSVGEALDIMSAVNIDWGNGPALHYLIADLTGESILIEFVDGDLVTIHTESPFQAATNFSQAPVKGPLEGYCARYDAIVNTLEHNLLDFEIGSAHDLLSEMAQANTQWSVVYDLNEIEIHIRMGPSGGEILTLQLEPHGITVNSE